MNMKDRELAAQLTEEAVMAKAEACAHMYIIQDNNDKKKIPARKRREAEKVFFANYREAEGRIDAIKILCPRAISVEENYGYKASVAYFLHEIKAGNVSPAYSYFYE